MESIVNKKDKTKAILCALYSIKNNSSTVFTENINTTNLLTLQILDAS